MATVPAHPRFAHMVLRAQQLGVSELGCLLAAVLSERDLFRGTGDSQQQQHADLAARLRVLTGTGECSVVLQAGKGILLSRMPLGLVCAWSDRGALSLWHSLSIASNTRRL